MSKLQIPKALSDEIRRGNVVLFLGSGFSYGAIHPQKKKAPVGQGLADMIAEEFLGEEYKGDTLKNVSKFAISETDLFKVQQFIYEIFEPFEPAPFHKILPTFKWKSIYTTNYDFIVEKAYRNEKLQNLSPVFRSTKDYMFLKEPNPLPYFKLHGCLSNINDPEVPLILTPEQYVTHRRNREIIFNKLFSEAWNHTVLFIGFSFADEDITTILEEIDEKVEGRPRYYFVGPGVKPAEERYWLQKNITPLIASYEEFIFELAKIIPVHARQLSTLKPYVELPIHEKFITGFKDLTPSEEFLSFIEKDITYVYSSMAAEQQDPKEFYKGYFESWYPIVANLDASRELTEAILTEVVISDHYNKDDSGQWLFVIKGYAGSGKSVLLKRLAWSASVDFDRFCIFYNKFSKIRYENVQELHKYSRQRIYIFIDNALSNEDDILFLLSRAKKENLPITVFTTERVNIWNNENNLLKYQVKTEYQLEYLSKREIIELLSLLERYKSLGHLEKKSHEERISLLSYKPGYELLVTLYEATQGEPYTKILNDEYLRIDGDKARSLYLTVSILHRLNAPARAGLIARVHGISTQMFREELYAPLEYIVFDRYDYRIQDYVYQTRHPYIAELLVETVLTTQDSRFDEYLRIIKYLDVDFQNDRAAFAALINAKKLMNDFTNHAYIRKIYETALINNEKNPKLLQQYAIFAMETNEMAVADKRIRAADTNAKGQDPQIKHTFAEFAYKRAEQAKLIGEKKLYLQQAIKICEELIRDYKNRTPHPFHTILKCNLYNIELALDGEDGPTVERAIKEFERRLVLAKQSYPYQDFILSAEARFKQLFDNKPAALELLLKAHEINPASPYIVTRLVKLLTQTNQVEKVGAIIIKSLKNMPGDKDINLLYAEHLFYQSPPDYALINHHLSKSYTENDNRHYAQFLHAKSLYLSGETQIAIEKFRNLRHQQIDPEIKMHVYDHIRDNGKLTEYTGEVKDYFYNHGWIARDKFGDEIFFHNSGISNGKRVKGGDKVMFNIGFTYGGVIAVNIIITSP